MGLIEVKNLIVSVETLYKKVEIIRNIRDYNWAKSRVWDKNIEETVDTRLQYNSSKFPDTNISFNPCYLKFDPSKRFISCSSEGKFKRTITVTKEDLDGDDKSDKIHVVSKVEWEEKNKTFQVYSVEDLYNWYEE